MGLFPALSVGMAGVEEEGKRGHLGGMLPVGVKDEGSRFFVEVKGLCRVVEEGEGEVVVTLWALNDSLSVGASSLYFEP